MTGKRALVIERTTAGEPKEGDWEKAKVYDNGEEKDLVIYLYGGDNESSVSKSVSGLPKTDPEGNLYTYRASELLPAEDRYEDGEAEEENILKEGAAYNQSYKVAYKNSHLEAVNSMDPAEVSGHGLKTAPGTGDTFNMIPLMALMCASLAGIAGCRGSAAEEKIIPGKRAVKNVCRGAAPYLWHRTPFYRFRPCDRAHSTCCSCLPPVYRSLRRTFPVYWKAGGNAAADSGASGPPCWSTAPTGTACYPHRHSKRNHTVYRRLPYGIFPARRFPSPLCRTRPVFPCP